MKRWWVVLIALPALAAGTGKKQDIEFQTSDRCMACHNDLKTESGKDVSIGFNWRSSMMANSSRDPYWKASVRRETIDHPAHNSHIQDECSICHMPVVRYQAKLEGHEAARVFDDHRKDGADGVTCSICHQIVDKNFGKPESFNGGFIVEPPAAGARPEYGPFEIDEGQRRIMKTSTGGFQPGQKTEHVRKSELCATCHTLITTAFGPDGKEAGALYEQMPYQEWVNSDFRTKQSCQDCHMPAVNEPAAITRVFGVPREGMKRHSFVAANFFMERMLNRYRGDLDVKALPEEMSAAADDTVAFLKEQAARLNVSNLQMTGGRLQADVTVENLGGHKLPTAYPSRRVWLHVAVRDSAGRVVFESGALQPDGSIAGNDNDADAKRFEPHYREITSTDQVQVYEDIPGDPQGLPTTGLLTAVRYLKDNRLLPKGFDKRTAPAEIGVFGEALNDEDFTGGSDRVRYSVPVGAAQGALTMTVDLMYQPIGFRWANNLKNYNQAAEPKRFTGYYDSMSNVSAQTLASVTLTR